MVMTVSIEQALLVRVPQVLARSLGPAAPHRWFHACFDWTEVTSTN
jgi:hypothetical protein